MKASGGPRRRVCHLHDCFSGSPESEGRHPSPAAGFTAFSAFPGSSRRRNCRGAIARGARRFAATPQRFWRSPCGARKAALRTRGRRRETLAGIRHAATRPGAEPSPAALRVGPATETVAATLKPLPRIGSGQTLRRCGILGGRARTATGRALGGSVRPQSRRIRTLSGSAQSSP